jgi:signal transduction histidine kinase
VPKSESELVEIIIDHLIDIHKGTCTLTDESILEHEDENLQAVLTGLMLVYETLQYREEKRQKALEELRDAKEAAEAAAAVKSDFLASVSHEVRSPLHVIIGMTEVILRREEDERKREDLETVRDAGKELLAIFNDILDLSRIEAGKIEVESAPIDLHEIVEKVTEQPAVEAGQKGLDLLVRIAPDTPSGLVGDPVRIRQVLTNLVDNAVKFTQEGHVLVSVECVRCTGDQAEIIVIVQDTGIGIPTGKTGLVFEKFSQVHPTTSRMYGGSGLGLTIARRFTELMGGSIGVRSEPGEGSTFWVSLNLPVDQGAEQASLPKLDWKGRRVLVVDDNETSRSCFTESLSAVGIESWACESAEQAIQSMVEARNAGEPFHAALVDHDMTGLDGIELARRIKLDPGIAGTNLVLVSVATKRWDVGQVRDHGFHDQLIRPVRRSRLLEVLESLEPGS